LKKNLTETIITKHYSEYKKRKSKKRKDRKIGEKNELRKGFFF